MQALKEIEHVNRSVQDNANQSTDWYLNKAAFELNWFAALFNVAFFDEKLPTIALSFDATNHKTLGHYIIDRNGLGLKENINLNLVHLNRPIFNVLSTLIHEMYHSYQKYFGTPSTSWLHNKEFRVYMSNIGIECNDRGQTLSFNEQGKFAQLLKMHGVTSDNLPIGAGMPGSKKPFIIPPKKKKGKSKLSKWQCSCGVNVRVGRKEFDATCNLCSTKFERCE